MPCRSRSVCDVNVRWMARDFVLHSGMKMTEREMIKKRLDAWALAAPLMEQFRVEDLRALTDEKSLWCFDAVTGSMEFERRDDEGLIEQQRLFQKLAPCPA